MFYVVHTFVNLHFPYFRKHLINSFSLQGYLTDNGIADLSRVQMIMSELGIVEDQIFKKRQQTEEMFRARDKAKRKRMKMDKTHKPTRLLSGQYTPTVRLLVVNIVFY